MKFILDTALADIHAQGIRLREHAKLDEIRFDIEKSRAIAAEREAKFEIDKYEREHMTHEEKWIIDRDTERMEKDLAEERRKHDALMQGTIREKAGDYLGLGTMGKPVPPGDWDIRSTSRPGISAVVNELVSEDTIAANRLHKLRELQDLVNRNPEVVRMLDLMEDLLFKR